MFCPKCGKQYDENQNFCRYCGFSLKNDNLNSVQDEQITVAAIDTVDETEIQENAEKELESELNSIDLTIKSDDEGQENNIQSDNVDNSENNTLSHANVDFDKYSQPEQKLTPKAYLLIAIVLIFLFSLASLLWSVDVETQINPSTGQYHDDFEINTPTDDDRTYTREPVSTEKQVEEEPVADIVPEENQQVQKEIMEQTQSQIQHPAEMPVQQPAVHPTPQAPDAYAPVDGPVSPKPSEE